MRIASVRSWILVAVTVCSGGKSAVLAQDRPAKRPARPAAKQVLINGETFSLKGKSAFIMRPAVSLPKADPKPWVFYAPTLSRYPDRHESWMHQQFLDAGIAVAGIDVGEAYGSPLAFQYFDALYDEMTRRGFSPKPVMLGRSRGGLWVSSYAIKHPDRVAAIAGIYPVFDFTTYPGVDRAAAAYGMKPDDLVAKSSLLNPVSRASVLADAEIPIHIIHGNDDKVVPIHKNSAAIERAYRESAADELITLQRIDGQGHNFWEGFFRCQPLVDFVIRHAK